MALPASASAHRHRRAPHERPDALRARRRGPNFGRSAIPAALFLLAVTLPTGARALDREWAARGQADIPDAAELGLPSRATHDVELALSKCRMQLADVERTRIARAVNREATRHGYDPLFVQALVEIESTCAPHARSRAGALGLAQVRPGTGRAIAEENGLPWRGARTLLDPDANLRLGIAYLRKLEARFGDVRLAVAAYNLGPERVAGMRPDRARRTDYVRRVLRRWARLRSEHGLS